MTCQFFKTWCLENPDRFEGLNREIFSCETIDEWCRADFRIPLLKFFGYVILMLLICFLYFVVAFADQTIKPLFSRQSVPVETQTFNYQHLQENSEKHQHVVDC